MDYCNTLSNPFLAKFHVNSIALFAVELILYYLFHLAFHRYLGQFCVPLAQTIEIIRQNRYHSQD